MNYDVSFTISSGSSVVNFVKNPSVPSIENFPSFIIFNLLGKNVTENDYSLLYNSIISYFNGTEEEFKNQYIEEINSVFEQSYSSNDDKLASIEDTFKNIMKNCKWENSKKIPSLHTVSENAEQTIDSSTVEKFLELFVNLYSAACEDETVEKFSLAILSKAVTKLSEPHDVMGNGKRIKKLVQAISAGIPPYAKDITKEAQIELESYVLTVFPQQTLERVSFSRAKTSNLTKNSVMTNSILKDRTKIMTERNIDDPNLLRYLESSSKNIDNLSKIKQKKPTSIPEVLGRNTANSFFSLFKKSGLRDTVVQSASSLIIASMPKEQIKMKTKEISHSISSLNIQSYSKDGEVYVNFSGNLIHEPISGSYSFSEDSVRFITLNAFYNSSGENSQMRQRIVKSIGLNVVSDENVWKAFLVFFFVYSSIVVHLMLNSDNILNVEIASNEDNILFMFEKDFMKEISESVKEGVMNLGSVEARSLLIFFAPKAWPTLMYG